MVTAGTDVMLLKSRARRHAGHGARRGMSAALVTGAGRDREIGTAVCRALAAAGHDIAFTVPPGGLVTAHDLEAELRAAGAQVAAIEVDLADAAALPQLLDEATERLGRLPSILVNNAAHSVNAGFAAFDAAILDDHYAVNLRAPARAQHRARPPAHARRARPHRLHDHRPVAGADGRRAPVRHHQGRAGDVRQAALRRGDGARDHGQRGQPGRHRHGLDLRRAAAAAAGADARPAGSASPRTRRG